MDGDRESFTAWAAGARFRLLRTAYLLTGDHHRAQDLVQEALTKVAMRWHRLRFGNPDAYARTILARDNVSWWRRHRREQIQEVSEAPVPAGEPAVERRVLLERALCGLTPRQRAVLVLRFYDDLTEQQAAETMGVSVGTVKSQTHLALRRLREGAPELAELLEDM